MTTSNVLVCGAGLMGHGIAQVMAAAGHKSRSTSRNCPRRGRPRAHRRQPRALGRQGHASPTSERDEQLGRIAVADLAGGRRARRRARRRGGLRGRGGQDARSSSELAAIAPPGAILASNTSSISITRLAAALPRSVARASWACTSSRPCRSCRYRADPRRRDVRCDGGVRPRDRGRAGQAGHRLAGPARASSSTAS